MGQNRLYWGRTVGRLEERVFWRVTGCVHVSERGVIQVCADKPAGLLEGVFGVIRIQMMYNGQNDDERTGCM